MSVHEIGGIGATQRVRIFARLGRRPRLWFSGRVGRRHRDDGRCHVAVRRSMLVRSVLRLIPDDERVIEVAYMWSRHRLTGWLTLGTFLASLGLAEAIGWSDWPGRMGIGAAVASVAVVAATDYRILALTTVGIVLLRSSKVRQAARELIERLPVDVEIHRAGGTILAADWEVDSRRYSVARSSEQAIARIAGT